jgi:hypothetical protein
VAALFCSLDLYQTISLSDFQLKNQFKSPAIILFILLNALISVTFFVLTCLYPGEWVAKTIGQEISHPLLRAVVVGLMVTAIIRSQLFNIDNSKGLGIDAGYSTLRTIALRRLHIQTAVEVNKLALTYQEKIRRCPNHDQDAFIAHIATIADDYLNSIHGDDIARRDRIIAQFEKARASISALPVSELRPEGLAIKTAMNFCGLTLIKKDLDGWISRHATA